MRTSIVMIGLLTACASALPASAFERTASDEKRSLAHYTLKPCAPAVRRAGRTIAAFDVGDQAVTFVAYSRRARARAMGNAEDMRRARAMGKVFDGAPQPALITLELSMKF